MAGTRRAYSRQARILSSLLVGVTCPGQADNVRSAGTVHRRPLAALIAEGREAAPVAPERRVCVMFLC